MESGSDVERRLVDIETKHSFQEASLQDMNKVIVEQATRIDALEVIVKDLREKLRELTGEGQLPLPQDERPPHY